MAGVSHSNSMIDNRTIHIALIAGTFQPDQCGVAHYTGRLRTELLQQGIHSTVLTTHKATQRLKERDVWGVVKDWQIADLWPLVRAVHQTSADVLHIQHAAGTYGFERAIFLLPLLLRLTGWQAPIVSTIHEYGWWEWQPRWLPPKALEALKTWGQRYEWWDREDGFLLTQSDAIITTNYTATETILNRLPNTRSRLYQIPIGANITVASIDRQQARARLCQHYSWPEDAAIFAFFGFLHPVKGLETLLSAFQQVQTIHLKARLLLIGGVESLALRGTEAASYWQKLEQRIAQLNLGHAVVMTGYLDDAIASHHLTAADIGVLPFNRPLQK
jgi:glycosyltransferase involved in cell wall biosynthesis